MKVKANKPVVELTSGSDTFFLTAKEARKLAEKLEIAADTTEKTFVVITEAGTGRILGVGEDNGLIFNSTKEAQAVVDALNADTLGECRFEVAEVDQSAFENEA